VTRRPRCAFAGRAAPVVAVGLDAARQVVVPQDVRRAGWYVAGPQPGDRAGSAVLVGHADDADQGLGTFAGLRDLEAGDAVVVRTASGRELAYRVVSFERFAKAEVPMDRLFTAQGPHRLVLVSCGGAFDPVRRTYADNVVVTAVPRR
jgi:sortase (surface protein transpeptidase)